jgi:hypothetical protein
MEVGEVLKMQRRTFLGLAAGAALSRPTRASSGRTSISIHKDQFWINGRPTYEGRSFEGAKIEGLLMNSRMINGVFDDLNSESVHLWRYPDTGKWDADRNTSEFIAAMPEWKRHGLLGFTLGMQGGSPQGYSKEQPWRNSAFHPDGSLRPDFMQRLQRILERADELGMVCILNPFYFGQDEHLESDDAVRRAVRASIEWVLEKGYTNVLVDLVNECDNRSYQQPLLKHDRIHEIIRLAQSINKGGRRLLVSTSFNGRTIPAGNVVEVVDFILLHGNGVTDPAYITTMVEKTRQLKEYRTMPVIFNEDDHFDFDKPVNNMMNAIRAYASWGYFDPGAGRDLGKGNYGEGYQSIPVNWGINTATKRAFFETVKKVTGS